MNINWIAKLKNKKEFFSNYCKDDVSKLFDGKSLLFYSLSNNDMESRYDITNFLLDEGASPNVVNECQETLLHILLSRTTHDLPKTIKICERLIDAGVDINKPDNKNQLALQYLINMKNTDEELEPLYNIWFSQSYVEVNRKNNWGKSPLDIAEMMPYRKSLVERLYKYV